MKEKLKVLKNAYESKTTTFIGLTLKVVGILQILGYVNAEQGDMMLEGMQGIWMGGITILAGIISVFYAKDNGK